MSGFSRLSTTSLLVVSYLVYYSDVHCCSQMRRRLMNFLKLNCTLRLYLVLFIKAVVATKVRSFHNSFIHVALWAVICLKDDSILFGDDTASPGNRSRAQSSRNCRLLQLVAVYGPDTFVRNVGT